MTLAVALLLAVAGAWVAGYQRAARIEAENTLRHTEERYGAAFESLPTGLAVLATPDGRCLRANQTLCDMLGRSEDELRATGLLQTLYHEDGAGGLQQLLDAERDELRAEQRFVRADGSLVWGSISGAVARDGDGAPHYVVLHVDDITDRKRAEAILSHRALHDPLTGLANRTLLMDRLERAFASQRRTHELVALLFVDLDRFKAINDAHGHEIGDQLLTEVAARLADVLRPQDTAARIGGDEFVLLCEGIPDRGAVQALAGRVQQTVSEPFFAQGVEVWVTGSIGIVVVDEGAVSPEAILREADTAMYRAKLRGRARVQLFDDDLRLEARKREEIESGLRRAIENEQLTVCYQPTVQLADGAVVGYEGLIRWPHPEHGLLSPSAFLDVAEDSGLIVPLGLWVLDDACQRLRAWHDEGRDLTVAVNLSARQLGRTSLVKMVSGLLEVHGLDPAALLLEIPESVLVRAGEATMTTLRALKELGVGLGVDDFGASEASMSYLRGLSVDFIKIDRSFIAGLGTDRDDTAMVEAIVALARSLGLATVAEGVETEAQADALRALGCTHAQGYLFGRPERITDTAAPGLRVG